MAQNLPLKIARRYFFSKKKKQFINIISLISVAVVAIGTMALIIALSVFNGFEGLVRQLHSAFNADLRIESVQKSFVLDSAKRQQIEHLPEVEIFAEVIEDNALLRYREQQMIVRLKGVSENYAQISRLDTTIVYGEFSFKKNKAPAAVLGRGVQYHLSINTNNQLDALQLWYPKKTDKVNLSNLDQSKSFNQVNLLPAGVFTLEQNYDEKYVFVPIAVMRKLLEYKKNRITAIELRLKPDADVAKVQARVRDLLGKGFVVRDNEEQDASLIKAIYIEKLFMFITLSFILGVASINIFFSLMMLVIEKKPDLAMLQTLGAEKGFLHRIFLYEGSIIAFSGALIGLFLGLSICLLQQHVGLVSMGTATTIVKYYPVELRFSDFIYTGITIVLITYLASYLPAKQAAKIEISAHL